jgi:hypothetical protein
MGVMNWLTISHKYTYVFSSIARKKINLKIAVIFWVLVSLSQKL